MYEQIYKILRLQINKTDTHKATNPRDNAADKDPLITFNIGL